MNRTSFREEFLFSLNDNIAVHPWEHSYLIKELAHAKAYDAAIFYLKHYSDHSVHCYTSAISALSPKLRLEDAFAMIKSMESKGKRANKFILTALFQYVQGGPEVLQLINDLQQQKHYPRLWTTEVHNAAIHACTRGSRGRDSKQAQDDFETAFYLFSKMKGEKNARPDLITYTSLFLACGMASQVQVAMDLLDEIAIKPNNVVWGAALNVCAKAGRPDEALQICKRMEEQRAQITRRHVGALLAAYAKAGDNAAALHILRALQHKKSTRLITDDGISILLEPVPINIVMVNIVVNACAVANDFANAKQLLDDLKEGKFVTFVHPTHDKRVVSLIPDEFTYNAVLAACSNSHQAKSLVREMRLTRRHRQGQVPPSARTYTLAINACKRAKDWKTARFLLEDCEHDGIEKNVFMYSAAIWTAVRCGNLADEALFLLKEMEQGDCKPNLVSYRGVLSAVAAAGKTDIALQLFTEMKAKHGITRDKQIFSIMMDALEHRQNSTNELSLSSDDEDRARFLESVVNKMDKDEFSVETAGRVLESLIYAYGTSDRFNDALRTFNKIQGPTNGPCLRAMMSSCALAKRWKEAISILHTSDIVEEAEGPALLDTRALGFAILACSKSGKWEEALNLLELYGQSPEGTMARNNAETIPLSALNSLIASCGRAQRPDLALKVLNEMQSRYGVIPNVISYRSAVIACNQGERAQRRHPPPDKYLESHSTLQWWECSLSLLRRLKEEGLQPDEQIYSSVVSSCQLAGKWQRALGVLRAMMIDYEKGYCEKLNLFCFNAAISACAKGGAWLEAVQIYYKMLDLGGPVTPDFVTLSSVVIALEDAGQKEMAQTLYEDGVKEKIVQPWTATQALDHLGGKRSIQAIDLHHFSSAMARIAIRNALESLLVEDDHEREKLPPQELLSSIGLVIIVGKGKGSELDHSILSPTVQKVLKDEYHIPYTIDPTNEGRLIVKPADLDKFVAKRLGHEKGLRKSNTAKIKVDR
eukprot:CAMPEP_0194208298 /NCGR_PEP_ID=MMETSP0156-20130528/6783_1 /TAXON_ID=33649 /ORGANISM="Thalassionema nitzschioides, Strain L26-B" /LENGTH=989 /DNA_ID=CAMNT_0038935231 /DNA_START=298 /DNA_END=3267 /DNA_ORIENTATION=+